MTHTRKYALPIIAILFLFALVGSAAAQQIGSGNFAGKAVPERLRGCSRKRCRRGQRISQSHEDRRRGLDCADGESYRRGSERRINREAHNYGPERGPGARHA